MVVKELSVIFLFDSVIRLLPCWDTDSKTLQKPGTKVSWVKSLSYRSMHIPVPVAKRWRWENADNRTPLTHIDLHTHTHLHTHFHSYTRTYIRQQSLLIKLWLTRNYRRRPFTTIPRCKIVPGSIGLEGKPLIARPRLRLWDKFYSDDKKKRERNLCFKVLIISRHTVQFFNRSNCSFVAVYA